MGKRFPGINWYCDHCNALLNFQPGFDDHHYVWKCKECGYKNSISADNIFRSEDDFKNHTVDEDDNYYSSYYEDDDYDDYDDDYDDAEKDVSYCDVCELNNNYPDCILRCPYDDD